MGSGAWGLVGVASVVMSAGLLWAGTGGDLVAEGAAMLGMRWGVVSLLEIYVGMVLFGGWVFMREARWPRAATWMLGVVLIGNIVSCLYVALALREADGDRTRFWLGASTKEVTKR